MDGRRHSVDVPISKTLVALRRVRSLRDPSTNSMRKFAASIDNLQFENNLGEGISLPFLDAPLEHDSDNKAHLNYNEQRENHVTNFELNCGLENLMWKSSEAVGCWAGTSDTQLRSMEADELQGYGLNQEEVLGSMSLTESLSSNPRVEGLDLAYVTPLTEHLDDEYLCYDPAEEASQPKKVRLRNVGSKAKLLNDGQVKLSKVHGDVKSHAGNLCTPVVDAMSSNSTPAYTTEDADLLDFNHNGCVISCCWLRTPRYSDIEDRPLILTSVDERALCGKRSERYIINEIIPSLETQKSLSQKFKPKSFNDLVGQNVVARSLLGAISKGRITSFYLFHGPRGTGKTSASRIFAAAMNCLSLEEHRPCGLCRECILFFSGRSKDVKEVDSVRINRSFRVKSLVKNAVLPPISSRFKVFIVDECQLLHGETWETLLKIQDNLPQHAVFVMVTPDLEKLPCSVISRSQRYYFPKIKDSDIATRLGKICAEEGLDFDQVALDFIASKSDGSLRDAEMVLDQLSLLGKKITISLAYELTGIVSDDELLDLLDLALSSDTSSTVKKARELMRSQIDPMQLMSQLANLIMDILAGKCQDGTSEVRRRFSCKHNSEADLQRLNYALRILLDAEKQLRMSKNQTTWFTVALLQLSSAECSSPDANYNKLASRNSCGLDGDFQGTSSTSDSFKHFAICSCEEKSNKLTVQEDTEGTLDSIWHKTTELCKSIRFKNFLRKRGRLSSLFINQGLAVAELEFHHPDHVSRAERSWKLIASLLQSVLGCNIEIRINLVPSASKYPRLKKSSFSLFSCSRRMQRKLFSSNELKTDSDHSDTAYVKPVMEGTKTSSSYCGSHECYHREEEAVRNLRNTDGNLLRSGNTLSYRSLQVAPRIPCMGDDPAMEMRCNCQCQVSSIKEPNNQPNCFPRYLWHTKQKPSVDSAHSVYIDCEQKDSILPIPQYTSETYNCRSDPHIFSCSSNCPRSSSGKESQREDSDLRCWRTPSNALRKVCFLRHYEVN